MSNQFKWQSNIITPVLSVLRFHRLLIHMKIHYKYLLLHICSVSGRETCIRQSPATPLIRWVDMTCNMKNAI